MFGQPIVSSASAYRNSVADSEWYIYQTVTSLLKAMTLTEIKHDIFK